MQLYFHVFSSFIVDGKISDAECCFFFVPNMSTHVKHLCSDKHFKKNDDSNKYIYFTILKNNEVFHYIHNCIA